MKNFNKLIKEALTPDFLKESVYDDPIKKKAEQGDTMNENKSIYDAKINQLPKEIQDALKGEWEDDDFEDVTVYYHERGPKEGTGYVNFAMFNPSAGDELHKSLTKAGLKLDPLRSFQDGNFIKVYLNKPINEIVTSDYEERVNLVVDSYFNGDPKVKEAAKEYASIKAARTMGGRYHTDSLFKDFYNKYNPLIADQALEAVNMADDDAMFNESINEGYNTFKGKMKRDLTLGGKMGSKFDIPKKSERQSKMPVRYEFPTSPTLFDEPLTESPRNVIRFDLLDNINTLDQYFLDLSPGDPAQREWEIYTEDLFYDYSGDGDSGFREVYWDDIDATDVNEAILFAYDLAERYNKNDIPNIYRS